MEENSRRVFLKNPYSFLIFFKYSDQYVTLDDEIFLMRLFNEKIEISEKKYKKIKENFYGLTFPLYWMNVKKGLKNLKNKIINNAKYYYRNSFLLLNIFNVFYIHQFFVDLVRYLLN